MGRAKAKVLLALDPDLLERLDRYTEATGHPSRNAALRHCIEVTLAGYAAAEQRSAQLEAEPNPWLTPAPVHTADSVSEAASRPLTRALMDG